MKRILIVDDDPDIVEQVKWLLEEQHFNTEVLHKLAGIFETIGSFQPDLILLDITLPDGDGRDVCNRIKSNPSTAEIPVVIFSSHPYIYDTIGAVQANDVITKPFDNTTFLNRINKQLGTLETDVEE